MKVPDRPSKAETEYVYSKIERLRPLINDSISHFRDQMATLQDDVPLAWGYVGGVMAALDDVLKRCPPECRDFVRVNRSIFAHAFERQQEEEQRS